MQFKQGFYEKQAEYSKDILSLRALHFAKVWAYLIENEIKKGRVIDGIMVKETVCLTVEIIDCTITTLNSAKYILINYWIYGDELKIILDKEGYHE